jgi:hypothetical protein
VKDFATERWRAILAHNGLDGFEDVWSLTHDWVERPNTRHGGFGAVARHELDDPDGGRSAFFVKIHRNRLRRTAARPWKATPALVRELANHRRCADAGVLSPTPVYCASRRVAGEQRGILVTEALTGFRPLEDLLGEWAEPGGPAPRERRRVIAAVAAQLRALHAARLVARSYTPKHVFVRLQRGLAAEVRLIDLERIKRAPVRRRAQIRDLVTLHLATPALRRTDRLRFFAAYLGSERLTPRAKRLWRQIAAASEAKAGKRGRC